MKRKRLILNAAIMPEDGLFFRQTVDRDRAVRWLRQYAGSAESCVGYPATQEHILRISGVKIPLSRDSTRMAFGDEALVVRLKYRLQEPASKSSWRPSDEDFEYLLVWRLPQPRCPHCWAVSTAPTLCSEGDTMWTSWLCQECEARGERAVEKEVVK